MVVCSVFLMTPPDPGPLANICKICWKIAIFFKNWKYNSTSLLCRKYLKTRNPAIDNFSFFCIKLTFLIQIIDIRRELLKNNFCKILAPQGPRVTGEKIRLDDIIHAKFKPNPFNATWHSGDNYNSSPEELHQTRQYAQTGH